METLEYNLTDICDFQGGTQPPKEEWISQKKDGYVRMLQIRDFTQDKLEHLGYVKDTKKLHKCNVDDILIGRYGASVGKILTGLAGAYNVAIIKTIPNEQIITKKYLYHVLKGEAFQNFILSIGARAAQAGFNKDDLSNFKIHVPKSQLDQEIVVQVLERINSLIEKRKKTINLIDDFVTTTFLKIFGDPSVNDKEWDKVELNKFGKIITGNTPPRNNDSNYSSNYIEWIKTDNIVLGQVYVTKSSEYLSQTGLSKARTVSSGALLVACIAGSIESIGRAALTNRTISFNQQINAIQPNRQTSPYFLYSLFKLSKAYVQNHASEGMKKMLTKGVFEKVKMIKPPFEIQNKFSEIGNQAETLKAFYVNSLGELHELYNEISQRAVKGKLTISNFSATKDVIDLPLVQTNENIVIDKINKELANFHYNQNHTGAPDAIDNKIRQLEAELNIRGEIPFWEDYVKYKLVKDKFNRPFTFDELWQEIINFPFDTAPQYDKVADMLYKWLDGKKPFIRQSFNENTRQIELILNETITA